MATANAYAIPTTICPLPGSSTTFSIAYQAVVGDGVQQSVGFGEVFTYDATQTPAANLAALKTAIAAFALNLGFTVDVSNILVLTAVN